MKPTKNYFIVGTNADALHDTMNGWVVGQIITCRDCKYYPYTPRHWNSPAVYMVSYQHCQHMNGDGFCSWAVRRQADDD